MANRDLNHGTECHRAALPPGCEGTVDTQPFPRIRGDIDRVLTPPNRAFGLNNAGHITGFTEYAGDRGAHQTVDAAAEK
jgi:hypothetical protein